MAEESVTCPIFKHLTALKGHIWSMLGGHFRREGARQNIECTGAEQEVECLSRTEEFELDSFSPVRHDFAMNPGLI